MKKILVLVLTFALLMTSAAAFAETKTPPPISSFATMKVKKNDSGYFITLNKMVDRLVINWTDGLGPEELLVNEDLQASSVHLNRKFLAGIDQRVSTAKSKIVYEGNTKVSEDLQIDPINGNEIVRETFTYKPGQVLEYDDNIEYKIWAYQQANPGCEYEITKPTIVYVDGEDQFGNKIKVPMTDENGNIVTKPGEIKAYTVKTEYQAKTKLKTNVATPDQTAFMTVQTIDDVAWAVYYNRSGNIVGYEPFEGQF